MDRSWLSDDSCVVEPLYQIELRSRRGDVEVTSGSEQGTFLCQLLQPLDAVRMVLSFHVSVVLGDSFVDERTNLFSRRLLGGLLQLLIQQQEGLVRFISVL
jgi:hypothetical protein